VVRTNHVIIGCFVVDWDGRIVPTCAATPCQVRGHLRSRNLRRQLPRSTALRKFSICALKANGSSRLMAWPVLGQIHRPALGRVDLSIRLVSRQRTSSSPTASNTGTVVSENWSRKSCNDGRKAWQRAIVFDIPSADCWRRRTMNSRQLFCWMRAGPRAILSDIEIIPCSIKIRARTEVSLNHASRWEG
jgi:hypothetical protein